MQIRKVGVLGAGVMGAGIAAHLANAGVPVTLLDVVPDGAGDRNTIADSAVKRMLNSEPAAFMHRRNAELVTTGNIEDHLDTLNDADWIIEAVVERLDIKRDLYAQVDRIRKPGSVVSSNTSTIPLSHLCQGLSERLAQDFLITHFFNPPRYMRLLELVAGAQTRPDAMRMVRDFCDQRLGKGVVDCKDTPGFIGNRIGVFWIQCAIVAAMEGGLTVEEADAVVGRPMGIPKTGVFALSDLVGLDLMPHVLSSMEANLPENDAFRAILDVPPMIERMISEGYTGRKGKGGFYRLNRSGGGRVKEARDLTSGEYRPAITPKLECLRAAREGGLRALVEHPDRGGQYAWRVLSQTLSYAASLVPAIAEDVVAVDTAMRLGFNWKRGPFQMIDQLGADWLAERFERDGIAVPPLLRSAADSDGFYKVHKGAPHYLRVAGGYEREPRADGVLRLSDLKLLGGPVKRNGSASLWDIGDGVACVEFHSKMNAMDPDILAMLRGAVDIVARDFAALVIYNEGSNFSVGANLGLLMFASNIAGWPAIEAMVREGQATYQMLRRARFPVVGAPSGMALGGGCEVLLHCDAVQAHAETYFGLVESGVGLIPAWGGCKELVQRWYLNPHRAQGPMPPVMKAFETISLATVAKSADEARDFLFLRPQDGITMNRDRLLADAKSKALDLVDGYATQDAPEISLPGPSAKAALDMAVHGFHLLGKATDHDVVVAGALAEVLSGGETDVTESLSEDALFDLERKTFMRLVRNPSTLARVEHMLETGKPLRN